MIVVFGEHRLSVEEGFEQYFNVSRIYVHNFNYMNFNNDIMLLKARHIVHILWALRAVVTLKC